MRRTCRSGKLVQRHIIRNVGEWRRLICRGGIFLRLDMIEDDFTLMSLKHASPQKSRLELCLPVLTLRKPTRQAILHTDDAAERLNRTRLTRLAAGTSVA